MRINCPWCGPRALQEFTYGGDATTRRPEQPDPEQPGNADLARWMDYVYLRDNPAGPHLEYWQHVAGCRAWLQVTRDTTSHAIKKVNFADPQSRGGET